MIYILVVVNVEWFGCFRSTENINSILRFVALGILIVVSGGVVVVSHLQSSSSKVWKAIYVNSCPCLVVTCLGLVPDACHHNKKVFVKVLSVSCMLIISVAWGLYGTAGDSVLDVPVALGIGSLYCALQWLMSAFLCTDECRKQLLDSLKRCCPSSILDRLCCCLEDDILVSPVLRNVEQEPFIDNREHQL